MRRRWGPRAPAVATVVVLALTITACSSRVTPVASGGQSFKPTPDEQTLWAKAATEEQALSQRTTAIDDPLLAAYLAGIVDKLAGDQLRAVGGPGLRIVVIRDATLNAFAMPDGLVYVHTGLLSRMENEAQLATILGHELAHVSHRDALQFARGEGSLLSTVAAAVAGPAKPRPTTDSLSAGVRSPTANTITGLGLTVAATAAVKGYGSDLEREADREAVKRLAGAGYDVREAPKAYRALLSESAERGPVETFLLGTPAALQERIETTNRLATTTYASVASETGRMVTSDDFEPRMRPVVRENAAEDIRLGRFALAQRQLDRVLKEAPADPIAFLYYGELHRLQSQRAKSADEKAGLARKAVERYERAAELAPMLADPYRQLGLLYYQQKDATRAKAAFERYLELKPDAPDARRVREYLVELSR